MSFKDLKPEYRQKLEHILDEFARVTKENEKLRQDVVQTREQSKHDIAKLQRENAKLRQQIEEFDRGADKKTKERLVQQPTDISSQSFRRTAEVVEDKLQESPSLLQPASLDCNEQNTPLHADSREEKLDSYSRPPRDSSVDELRKIESRLTEFIPSSICDVERPRDEVSFQAERGATMLRPSSVGEHISAQIRQSLPDLNYLQTRLNAYAEVSLSEDVSMHSPGASGDVAEREFRAPYEVMQNAFDRPSSALRPADKPETRSIALEYSEVPKNELPAAAARQEEFYDTEEVQEFPAQRQHTEILQKTPFPHQSALFSHDEEAAEREFRRSRRPSEESPVIGFAANIILSEAGDDQKARVTEQDRVALAQIREAKPPGISAEHRSEILEQSRVLMLNARKELIKRKEPQPQRINDAAPADHKAPLIVSGARLARDTVAHEVAESEEQLQKQRIMKSLTSMQEEELDDLLKLLNSGVDE